MATAQVALSRVEQNGDAARLALIGGLALVTYALLWPAVTGDMRHCLVPWLDTILERGGVHAFAAPFSNYTPPYLYLLALVSPLASVMPKITLIKALSVGGTVCLALAVRRLLRVAGADRSTEAALWLLVVPSIAINGAAWGQCDAFWSAACVMAVAAAVERRAAAMLVWFGVAIAFKAQAMFLAPFVAQRLIADRTPLLLWPVPALVYAGAMLPAALAGWPVGDLFTIYLRQAAWGPDFIGNAANPWAVVAFLAPGAGMPWTWVGYAAALVATGAFLFTWRRSSSGPQATIALALLATLLIPFLLPKMHERFFFLADVLAFVLLFERADRRSLILFVLVEGSSMAAIVGLMLNIALAPVIGCAMMGAAILLLAFILLAPAGRAQDRGAPFDYLRAA